MRSENLIDNVPIWRPGTRVRLLKEGHRRSGECAKIVAALANPSKRPGNQWYDIRFDDGVYGRFVVRHLAHIRAVTASDELGSAA
jgi:hypothetical protein